MSKILGLDLGTNSIGWAITEQAGTGYRLLDKGVDIFQEGVAREKNNEKPAVQDRTNARALRRHYFRRRLRKIELLKILIRQNLCPALTDEQLAKWREKKIYPLDEEFLLWQRTNDNTDKNPYHDRYRALTEELDLNSRTDRYALGRALYHLAQRRGFISSRKETGKEAEDGLVKKGIKELASDMDAAGCRYLGEYFYRLYQRKDKIRKKYTSRNEHYLTEFRAICLKQHLPPELQNALERAIFYQRPLKSQKGSVGRCTFEKTKSRCPASHPRFEEFRMLQFINNIRIAAPGEAEPRPLSKAEADAIHTLFLRKSKPHFDFEQIARKIAGKGRYACKGDRNEAACRFNFSRITTVTGCPVTAALVSVFGDNWLSEICRLYTHSGNKDQEQILNDVWHALFSFDDEDRLRAWAEEKLQLTDEQAKKFAAIRLPQDYAALSLNAINKILPHLRQGYRYDEAVFLANLGSVITADIWRDPGQRAEITEAVAATVAEYEPNPYDKTDSKERRIYACLRDCGVPDKAIKSGKLYHPSMIDVYQDAKPDKDGVLQLGSPRTPAIRNPMAMRALFRLRSLVNKLLRDGRIDPATKINIEFARGLNDANRRKAIEQYQRDREAERKKYAEEIRKQYASATGQDIEPTDDDLLKYQLWEEQKHTCLYTGDQICISDFIGGSTRYDFEHTVPRSRGGDNSQMNKTLCQDRFNRETKKNKLPSELSSYTNVLARIETLGWQEKIDSFQKQIEGQKRRSKNAATKSEKDSAIQRCHYLRMKLDYWRGKYERLTMTEIPAGFSNRQGVDIGIIGRYARLYLKTVFKRIYTVKGATTAEFRKMWGLQDEYAKKERINHIQHGIDAIIIACIGRNEYDRWAQYMADEERYERGEAAKPRFEKPWTTFTQDVRSIADELLIPHHTPDNMPKKSRKRLRIRGKVQTDKEGNAIYVQGDTARGSLHQQTFYGAIKRGDQIKYVVRKSLDQLQPADVDRIVDEAVKQQVQKAIEAYGFKEAMNLEGPPKVWMNEQKGVPIRKVRIFTPGVTSPIHLKKQRDLSDKAYKRDYHVANDANYCMAVYEGTDGKGKTKRSFEIVNNLEAAQYFKASADRTARPDLVPQSDANGYPLKCILKTGTMALFYENSPEELYECTSRELTKRLYKVIAMSQDGRAQFLFHQEAREQKAIKEICGMGASSFDAKSPAPKLRLSVSSFNMLVEGYDFELTVTGEIIFKR